MKKILHLALACVALLSLMPHPALFAPAATSTVVVPEFNKNRHMLAHVALFAALHLAQIGYNGMLNHRQASPATKAPANRTLKQRAAQAAANAKAFLKALATLQSYKNYGAELKAILPAPTKTGTKLSAKQWALALLAGTKIFIKNHQIVSVGLPLQFILGGGYTWVARNAHLAGLAERAADQARLNAEFEKQERETAAGIKLVKIGKKFMKGFKFRKVVQQAKEAAEAERLAKEAAAKAKADKVIKIQCAYRQRLARKQLEKLNKIKKSSVAKKLKRAGLKRKTISAIKAKRELDLDKKRKVRARELFERDNMANEDFRTDALELAALKTNLNVFTGSAKAVIALKKKLNEIRSKKATPTPPQSNDEDGDANASGKDHHHSSGEDNGDDADNNSGSDTPVHTPKPAEVPKPDEVPQADGSGDDDVETVSPQKRADKSTHIYPLELYEKTDPEFWEDGDVFYTVTSASGQKVYEWHVLYKTYKGRRLTKELSKPKCVPKGWNSTSKGKSSLHSAIIEQQELALKHPKKRMGNLWGLLG